MSIKFNSIAQYNFSAISISEFDVITVVVGLLITCWLWIVSKKKRSVQLRGYIPTIWTSLGIFFTFLSIYLSLLGYSDENRNFSIIELVKNIIPAFSTSIIGILGAIVSTIANRRSIANMEYDEDEKFRKIKQNYCGNSDSDSPELMLLQIVRSIEESSDKTCEKLDNNKQSNDDCLVNVLNQIIENKNAINATIQESQQKQNKDFNDAISLLSGEFIETVNGLKKLFDIKLDSINEMLSRKIDGIVENNTKLLSTLVDLQKDNLSLVKTQLVDESEKRNSELERYIKEENELMQNFVENQDTKLEKIYKEINEQISFHIDRESQLFESDVKHSIEEFAKVQYSTCVSTIKECSNNLLETSNSALQRQFEVTNTFINDLGNGLTMTCESLIGRIDTLSHNMISELQSIHTIESKLIEKTVVDNKGLVEDLLIENKNEIAKIVNEMKSDNTTIKETLIATQGQWREETKKIEEKHLKEAERIYSDFEKDIRNFNSNIDKYKDNLQLTLGDIKQQLETLVRDVKDFIIDNNKDLQIDLTKQIHESFRIQELEQVCNNLINGVKTLISSLNTDTGEISNSLSAINSSLEESSKKYIDTVVNSEELLSYINDTLLVDKENITSVVAILGEIDILKKTAKQIEEDLQKINSLHNGVNEEKIRSQKQ